MKRGWWALTALGLVVGAGLLAYLASVNPSFGWDAPLAEEIRGFDPPGFHQSMEVVSWSGLYPVAIVSWVLVLLLALRWQQWRQGALVVAAALLDLGNDGIKALVARPRPVPLFLGEADSFPSGHTVHAVLLLGMLWLLVAPRLRSPRQRAALGALLVSLDLLVGLSRVYLVRHWPSDVLGAYLIGGLVLWGLGWLWGSRWVHT